MNNILNSIWVRRIIILILFYFLCVVFLGCASSSKVEIAPGETVKVIIVVPKKETPKERWNWKTREYLRKEKKEVKK